MENLLVKKLRLNKDMVVSISGSPEGYLDNFAQITGGAKFYVKIKADSNFIQCFVNNKTELIKAFPGIKKAVPANPVIWITYPKQSSIIKTDINRDICAGLAKENGFTPVSLISIDETWSSLRIKSLTGTSEPQKKIDNYKIFINSKKKIVKLPGDMESELNKKKDALEFFNSLAYSHKKEYVMWVLDAKKEETRRSRIKNTVEKLQNHIKNPSG